MRISARIVCSSRPWLAAVLVVLPVLAATGRDSLAAQTRGGLGGFHEVSSTAWLDHGKPVVLFVAAQYCVFCAAERWALVLALGRFGQWTGLGEMGSTPGTAGFPRLPTYDLLHATYTSGLIALQEREVADHQGHPLQPLTADQIRAVDAYDRHGSVPFTFLAGRYAQISSGYSPGLLVGLTFARAHQLVYEQPSSRLGRAVGHEADIISALLCRALGAGGRAAAVCASPVVRAMAAGH